MNIIIIIDRKFKTLICDSNNDKIHLNFPSQFLYVKNQ